MLDRSGSEQTSLLAANNTMPLPSKLQLSNMRRQFQPVLVLFVLSFFIEVCVILQAAPQIQILEDAICDKYYSGKDPLQAAPTHRACKAEPIQRELSLVRGWQNSLDQLPGFIMALPYGALAEKWGRRPVLVMALAGYLASVLWIQFVCWNAKLLPIRLTWLSSLYQFVGGGGEVFYSMVYTIASDVATEEQRTTLFMVLVSLPYLAEITATPAVVALMHWNPWIPLLLADATMVILVAVALVYSEPRKAYRLLEADADGEAEEDEVLPPVQLPSVYAHLQKGWQAARLVIRNRTAVAIFFALFMTAGQHSTNDLVLIYASKKFNWTIANASFLAQMRGVVSLLLTLFILPAIVYLQTRHFSMHPEQRDLVLARLSTLVIAIGFVVLGFAPKPLFAMIGVATLALGSGSTGLCKSLVVSLFDSDTTAIILSAVAMQKTIGAMTIGPLSSYLYGIGLRLGEAWYGLPFVVLGGMFLFCCLGLLSSRLRSAKSIGRTELAL